MFEVTYSKFGYTYSESFSKEQAIEEIINYGFPVSKQQANKLSDIEIGIMLNETFNQ